jgi:hypothetical protein
MTYEFRKKNIEPELVDEMEAWLDVNAGWGKYYAWRNAILLIGDNLSHNVSIYIDEEEVAALFKLRFGL